MESGRRGSCFLSCFLVAFLVSQNFVAPVISRSLQELTDQNKDVEPDCDCTEPTPSHGGGGSPVKPTPTPSHGGGVSPIKPTPTPSHGGGYTPSPAHPTPSHGGGGGGGYYHSPPTAPIIVPPVTPSHGGGGGYHHSPPTTPIIVPPVTPVNPTPPSPLVPDPHGPPFSPGTCNYWSTHPTAIWAIFGYWGNVGQFFGAACGAAFGRNLSLPDALKNSRADGIGALYREGTAALLNSLTCQSFPYTNQQVKDTFAAAIVSDKAAADQARLFKLANEGKAMH